VRENRTQGAAWGASGNWRSYLNNYKMTIEQYRSVHECEELPLRFANPCDFSSLSSFITELGGEQEIDAYFFKRGDSVEPWQEVNYAAIQPLTDSTFSTCQSIWFSCFLAEIPESQIRKFLELFGKLFSEFEGLIFHHDLSYSFEKLSDLIDRYVSEIRSNWGFEPGSKKLADLIASSAYYEASRKALAAENLSKRSATANNITPVR
jgi:hypothetical protein